jgi:glycosyltransferase involved in cell wall biosynthesis
MESLSIILPIYNEQANVEFVICEIITFFRKLIKDFELIAINDGSTDATLEVIKGIKSFYPELKIISQVNNMGYGHALKTGISFAQKEWIFIMDSDRQFKIDDFITFWNEKHKYDFILGYRKPRKDNFYRLALSKVGNFFANAFLEKKINDVNCGFKLFKSECLKSLPLSSTGGSICFEILYYLLNSKIEFAQLAVRHKRREVGRQTGGSLKVVSKTLWESIRIVIGI